MSGEERRLRHVAATVHGRYLLTVPTPDPTALVVGFHGYGEGAEEALDSVDRIAGERPWARAAVQALHPFYRRRDGAVVSSWMTSLDRDLALADNIAYVNRALTAIRQEIPSVRRTAIVGFSQGVAMAYRAAAHSGHPCHALVVLAGDVPPELHELDLPGFPPVLIGRGTEETWYSEPKLAEDRDVLRRLDVRHEVAVFEGGHEWAPAMVDRAASFLDRHLIGDPS